MKHIWAIVSCCLLTGCATTSLEPVGYVSYIEDNELSCSSLSAEIESIESSADNFRDQEQDLRNSRIGLAVVEAGVFVATGVGALEPTTGLIVGAGTSVISAVNEKVLSDNIDRQSTAVARRERLISLYEANDC